MAAHDNYQGVPIVHIGSRLDFGLTTAHAKDLLRPHHVHYARAASGEFIALLCTQEDVYVKPSLEQQRAMFRSAKTPSSNLVTLGNGVSIPILPPELYASRVVDGRKRSEKNANTMFVQRVDAPAVSPRSGPTGGPNDHPAPPARQIVGFGTRSSEAAARSWTTTTTAAPPRPAARHEAEVEGWGGGGGGGGGGGAPPVFRGASNESDVSELSDSESDDVSHPSLRVFRELRAALRSPAAGGAAAMFEDPFAGVEAWQDIVDRYGHDACVLLFQAFNAWHPDA